MLTGSEIVRCVNEKLIVIKPFNADQVNPNSYDVRLADKLFVVVPSYYDTDYGPSEFLDIKHPYDTAPVELSNGSWMLVPGALYLGSTVEWTETDYHVPIINGKSTTARYGIVVHQTGGFGDLGFHGTWTLEITVTFPTLIYPNMRIGQIAFDKPEGVIESLYGTNGHYQGNTEAKAANPASL